MTFEETVRESIRKFYAGKAFTASSKVKEFKYTKEYFDRIEEEMLGSAEVDKKETKRGNKRKSS